MFNNMANKLYCVACLSCLNIYVEKKKNKCDLIIIYSYYYLCLIYLFINVLILKLTH